MDDRRHGVVEVTNNKDARNRIRQVLHEIVGRSPVSDSENLRDNGLDSFTVIELTIALESEFLIAIPDEQLEWCSMESVDRITETVLGLLPGPGGTP